jgi:hypothetical protein
MQVILFIIIRHFLFSLLPLEVTRFLLFATLFNYYILMNPYSASILDDHASRVVCARVLGGREGGLTQHFIIQHASLESGPNRLSIGGVVKQAVQQNRQGPNQPRRAGHGHGPQNHPHQILSLRLNARVRRVGCVDHIQPLHTILCHFSYSRVSQFSPPLPHPPTPSHSRCTPLYSLPPYKRSPYKGRLLLSDILSRRRPGTVRESYSIRGQIL